MAMGRVRPVAAAPFRNVLRGNEAELVIVEFL